MPKRFEIARRTWLSSSAGFAALMLVSGCATRISTRGVVVERLDYHGWPDALSLQNAHIEAIVVPQIGRVMSLRFRDDTNIFWEDRTLDGQPGDPTGKHWVNFGGDKTWPAPEAEWKNYTRHTQWMPPPSFDGLPATARIEGDTVVLASPVDPFYGIRALRRISLAPDAPVMTIETTYERVSGTPSKIGIWVITQFVDPIAVYVPIPPASRFRNGHFSFRETPWPQLTARDGLLRITRDPAASHKLGSDADRMLWVGETTMCLVTSPRSAGAEYPDRGASAEVYTNPNPKKYIELETLGPLALLKPGDTIRQTNTYTLHRRPSGLEPHVAAQRLLARN